MKLTITGMSFSAFMAAAAVCCGLGVCRAETVTQGEAKKIASQFFNAAYGRVMSRPDYVYNGRKLATQRLFTPFYVYNLSAGGYVVIAADNKAFPVLAYSLKDKFDPNHINDGVLAVLRGYALDIEKIRYDSRVPEMAIKAWTDLPHYIDNLLKAEYSVSDPAYTIAETEEMVNYVADGDGTDDMWSDIYSPQQWEEMINEEYVSRRSVALGIVNSNRVTPVTIHGRKGDYYRIRTEVPDHAYFRLFATEFLSDGQLAMLANPIGVPEPEQEDETFRFYEDFVAENNAAAERRQRKIESAGIVTEPRLHGYGSGAYMVELPETAVLARVYNLGGALVRQHTYGETDNPHINIMEQPAGFYVAVIYGVSGKPYSFKLVR